MSPSPWKQERHMIKCCHGCVPPKRYPGCGDHCKEYKDEKAQYVADMKREKERKKNNPVLKDWDFNRSK